jgi:hypothetical protein
MESIGDPSGRTWRGCQKKKQIVVVAVVNLL